MWSKIRKSEQGEFILTKCELELLLEQASQKGAKAALAELGLHDENAPTDIRDMRELLNAFRMAKKDSFRILIKCLIIGFMTIVTAGLSHYLEATTSNSNNHAAIRKRFISEISNLPPRLTKALQ